MKKKIMALILLVAVAIGMIGCGRTECDWCGDKARCKTYSNFLFGEMDICSGCAKNLGMK